MKCVANVHGDIRRVSNDAAYEMVKGGQYHYIPSINGKNKSMKNQIKLQRIKSEFFNGVHILLINTFSFYQQFAFKTNKHRANAINNIDKDLLWRTQKYSKKKVNGR